MTPRERAFVLELSRTLVNAVARGALASCMIPAIVGDRWLRTLVFRRGLSATITGDYYTVTPKSQISNPEGT